MDRRVALVFVSLLALGARRAEPATLEKVAVEGDPAPQPGSFYRRKFQKPAVSDATGARVAASVRTFINPNCLVSFDPGPGPDAIIVCRKDPSPDGHQFGTLGNPSINITSEPAWAAAVTFARSGVFRGSSMTVAFTGDPSPAGSGFLRKFSSALITDGGDVVFQAIISGGAVVGGVTVDQGFFRCTGGNGLCSTGGTGTLQTLVLKNDPVLDRPGRKLCKLQTLSASTFGIAFLAETQLDCSSTTETPLEGIFRKPFAGAVVTVALQGEPSKPQPAPGGTTYALVAGPVAIEKDGIVAFLGATTGLIGAEMLFLCDPASCPASQADVAVQQGDPDGNGDFFQRFSTPALSDAGDIAFQGRVNDGLRSSGIYIRRLIGGTIATVARLNDVAPGVSPTAQFTFFAAPSMSPGGKVAFKVRVRQVASSPRTREGLFLFE